MYETYPYLISASRIGIVGEPILAPTPLDDDTLML